MNIEKAIEILKEQYTTVSKCLSIKEATEQNTAINLAISALEKQAPKNAMGKGSTKEVGYCPNCKSHLMYEPKTNYCRWCGQRLSWEVENE